MPETNPFRQSPTRPRGTTATPAKSSIATNRRLLEKINDWFRTFLPEQSGLILGVGAKPKDELLVHTGENFSD